MKRRHRAPWYYIVHRGKLWGTAPCDQFRLHRFVANRDRGLRNLQRATRELDDSAIRTAAAFEGFRVAWESSRDREMIERDRRRSGG